ncbi:hypothetical protein FNW25_07510 [Flavobacterium franklandianum]|uniref:DUF5683 domain-containing protein n=1 Tax=Flavobacterium franklandianum TaxID=2594430 RepID=A0A553CJX6_9FLAO|nr:DUF5683 domain-containing protein [Flavobacterium franklandianum]TRX20803.1 hypothetical protein FNW17_10535 [Flavobacterium franklandianum]TRX26728.1 hypothetical protein FNW25_07510 [Flavobacterium franklandianum]
MNKIYFIVLFLFTLGTTAVFSQSKTVAPLIAKDTLKSKDIDPLTPAKAAFYSAILPGLGQAYNKKYWKIPIVYGAIGVSMYYYIDSNQKYHQYRDAYKRRLEGYTDDEFSYYDNDRLISAQKFYQRNRDLSALFVVGFYVLNIVDANVDAALIQFNVNENLTVRPDVYMNDVTSRANVGLTFNYNF